MPNQSLVGGFEYENVICSPDQFAVVDTAILVIASSNSDFIFALQRLELG